MKSKLFQQNYSKGHCNTSTRWFKTSTASCYYISSAVFPSLLAWVSDVWARRFLEAFNLNILVFLSVLHKGLNFENIHATYIAWDTGILQSSVRWSEHNSEGEVPVTNYTSRSRKTTTCPTRTSRNRNEWVSHLTCRPAAAFKNNKSTNHLGTNFMMSSLACYSLLQGIMCH